MRQINRNGFYRGFVLGLTVVGAVFLMSAAVKNFSPLFSGNSLLSQVSPGANEAVLYLSPEAGSFSINDTFTVEVRMGASAGVTAVKSYINFNASLLSAQSINRSTSAFSNWIEEAIDNTSGVVKLQAGQPSPGVCGSGTCDEQIAVITFRVIGGGTATVSHAASSLALKPTDENILNLSRSTGASFQTDTVPPNRSNASPSGALPYGTTSTTLTLATGENATCKYATTAGVAYASMANTFATTGGMSHSSTVSGLSDGSSYSYYVRCQDTAGNANTNDFLIEFSVAPTPDTTPPTRSGANPSGELAGGTTSVILALATGENATCKYATTAGVAYASMANTFATTGGMSHSSTVSGLSSGSSYSYYVRCQDASGNANTTDFPIEFSIGVPPDSDAPNRSGASPSGVLSSGTTSTTISLTTNEAATCKYATTAGVAYASMANTFATTGSTAHSRVVTGLSDGSSYSYYVRCQDTTGNANTNDFPIEFSVAATDVTPPSRANGQPSGTLSSSTSSATLSLTTHENATCKYSTTVGVAYASMANTFATTGSTSHSTALTGLTSGQQYSYYVRCQDGNGNANSSDYLIEFSVAAALPPIVKDKEIVDEELLQGDLNGDGKVNVFDLSILFSNWGKAVASYDINGNGTVDILDMSIVFSNWTG